MGFRTLNEKEVSALLGEQRVVRVGFEAADHRYLLPFAYIWLNGNLYGATSPGRKTRMTEQNAKVAFQVDNAQVPWEWQSVTGEGVFELITDPTEIARAEPVLQARFSDMPEWFQQEQAAKAAAGELFFWRIRPSTMTGREHARDD